MDGTPHGLNLHAPGSGDGIIDAVLAALPATHRLHVASAHPAPSGTRTQNFSVRGDDGRTWFVKVDITGTPPADHTAVARLTEHARSGGVPAPRLLRNTKGHWVTQIATSVVTVWEHIDHERTAEGSMTTTQMSSLGAIVGRLHTRLERYGGSTPRRRAAASVMDVPRGHARLTDLVDELRQRPHRNDFQEWALHAADQRLAALPEVAALVERLPPLHTQVVHGDLAAPNILVRSSSIAALVDFDVPRQQHSTAWEVARSGCDPRVVMGSPTWLSDFAEYLRAYRQTGPPDACADLVHSAAVGCAYTLISTYPLLESLRPVWTPDPGLESYARARHSAGHHLLDNLADITTTLADALN